MGVRFDVGRNFLEWPGLHESVSGDGPIWSDASDGLSLAQKGFTAGTHKSWWQNLLSERRSGRSTREVTMKNRRTERPAISFTLKQTTRRNDFLELYRDVITI